MAQALARLSLDQAPVSQERFLSTTQGAPFPVVVPKDATQVMERDALMTVEDVARRLNVSKDWVWDHSSRKEPYLPVIRMGDGALRYRAGKIEEFITERERLTNLRRKRK